MTNATWSVLALVTALGTPALTMKVTYDPAARGPYGPQDAVWSRPLCDASRAEGVTPPRLKHKPAPERRHPATEASLSRPFLAEFTISAEGRVTEAHVLQSVSEEDDAMWLRQLEGSIYEPATLKGTPVAVCRSLRAQSLP
jgi:hypothetical protein